MKKQRIPRKLKKDWQKNGNSVFHSAYYKQVAYHTKKLLQTGYKSEN